MYGVTFLDDGSAVLSGDGNRSVCLGEEARTIIKSLNEFYDVYTDEYITEWNERLKLEEDMVESRQREKKETRRPKASVYVMKDNANGRYKIGRSVNPTVRESTLQSEKPDITLLFHYLCDISVEDELHTKYTDKRIRGEWFELDDKDVEDIQTYLMEVEYTIDLCSSM